MDKNLNELKATSWGAPALSLLSHIELLVSDAPALVMVRHSERDDMRGARDLSATPLNEKGRQTAREFGNGLPANRTYCFYHSPIVRCMETAEMIREGVIEKGGAAGAIEELQSLCSGYLVGKKYVDFLFRDGTPFIYNWIAGHYPPQFLEPCMDIAKRTAGEMSTLLQSARPEEAFVCVSHDHQITAYLFHWAGILATDSYIQFLDGFILQQVNGKLIVYHKNGKKELFPPYWWGAE